jgi:uncharacterized protein YecE (DUF72 family)
MKRLKGKPHSGELRIGVCGFCLPQREIFQRFRLLEVQQTFYWPPQLKTVERWRLAAPDDFVFTLKAFQAITHVYNHRTYRKVRFSADELAQCGGFCDSAVVREAWKLTRSLAEALESPTVVFQCPPSYDASEANIGNLRQFFHWASRGQLRFAWEPRHESWTASLVFELCNELDLIHAVDPLEQKSVFGTPRYYRLHGSALGAFRYDYDHPYSDSELRELERSSVDGLIYCLFNNKQMAADAERFQRLAVASSLDFGVEYITRTQ